MFNSTKIKTVRFIILAAFAVFMIYPFWYMLVISLKDNTLALTYPPPFIPTHPTIKNFVEAWTHNNFGGYFLRSLYVTIASTVLGTLGACGAAFVFSRYRFFGRKLIFRIFLVSMMIPTLTFILPQFQLMKSLGLLNSLTGLFLIYSAGMIPFTTFLMKGFFDDVPQELEDSVLVDGGGKWAFFSRILMPMSTPSLVTAVLFNFMVGWDEFLQALTFLRNPHKFTFPIALMLFQGQHTTQWGQFFAASLIQTAPVVILFVIFQRHIVKGLLLGSIKG
ncbi:MAG TPA: carbohydrate ABC transporter permease [Bacillales bacterium]|nr:carbohydrate ABC transporter permease [Bacillales bacterium]